ncbi:glycerol kinase [Stella humosa]|uniref:Glycerol kinase n=1 Tax=Stella humosa TaxID=94 RepID=A0A3N1KS71_9PROT|nr:glycerol kinase GlpK [Stella humosa]ROP83431.1 glycerol kinase [Stella humosa]BBK33297.1 glycerol kinase 1 [Stella humosa]
MAEHVLAIDQGTTSTRAIVFTARGRERSRAQAELTQHYPGPGWVEHDAEEIWQATLDVTRQAMAGAGLAACDIAGIGITNQRETTILWDRATGRPVAPAIVWQDRRTAERCAALAAEGAEPMVRARTGLLLDPYFSATKIAWLLDRTEGLRARAERGEIAFGTVDCFLLWRLTGGRVHATDATNAARTLLFDIHRQDWDDELLRLFGVPRAMLPAVHDCAHAFGTTDPALFGGAIAVRGMAGDQQAATIGQACVRPGMIKSTYGTGCFMLLNTGDHPVVSQNRLLTTVAYRLDGRATYALEGSIFVAGAAVQWLRDGLRLIASAGQTEQLAHAAAPERSVYLVPAFTGLGAPYWDADARGAILGLTRDTGIADIVRAALEAVCFQTRDLLEAMTADGAAPPTNLRVDGGMTANDWAMQFLADMLAVPVERPAVTETTALGAAALAGIGAGIIPGLDALETFWHLDRRYEPAMATPERDRRYAGWKDAVSRVRTRA